MLNNTTSSSSYNLSFSRDLPDKGDKEDPYIYAASLAIAVTMAVLSPVAVVGNALILAAVWKKTFQRTSFHILLSGLALTDLCTGLIVQPVHVATILLYSIDPLGKAIERPLLYVTFETIADASATYFVFVTILILMLMSVERWLHMSRRSLVTSRRGCSIAIVFFLIPIPIVVLRSLETINRDSIGSTYYLTIIALMLLSFVTIFFAYFKVLRIIHSHQLQVQAGQPAQRFGQPAINLAKYKKSAITILYILASFSFCFLPFVVSIGFYVYEGLNSEISVAIGFSLVLVFLSSSLNPCLYLWRMNDIRNGVKQLLCSSS